MTTEERYILWLDNEYGLYHEVVEQVAGVLDEGYHIRTLENFLTGAFDQMCGFDERPRPSFLLDFLDEPDFEDVALELVSREKAERECQNA
jgi:hypothetical protein